MAKKFEDKAFGSVGIESNRNKSNYFDSKNTPKPTKPDETQDVEVTREITVLVANDKFTITSDGSGTSMVDKLKGHGIHVQQNGDLYMISGAGGNGTACGGRFIINAKGGQLAKYEGPVITEASASSTSPVEGEGSNTSETSATGKLACSNLYYGDALQSVMERYELREERLLLKQQMFFL